LNLRGDVTVRRLGFRDDGDDFVHLPVQVRQVARKSV